MAKFGGGGAETADDGGNHHSRAAGFTPDLGDQYQEHLGVISAKPAEESDESFVRYGPFDYLDLLLNYNFLGTEAAVDFVRSVPVELDFGKFGRIIVNSSAGGGLRSKLPQKIRDLKFWIPSIVDKSEDHLEVSHLLIPATRSLLALRRTLKVLLNTLGTVGDPKTAQELILEAERQVLRANLEYYAALRMTAENAPVSPLRSAALSICELQIDLIEQYKSGLKQALAKRQAARVNP